MARLDAIRLIWTVCFLVGAANHARDLWIYGWLPYNFMSMPFNVFWTALLPLDLSAAALVRLRPSIGAWLGLTIMVADVLVNSWTVFAAGFRELLPFLGLQALFLLFVVITFRQVRRAHEPVAA